MAPREQLLIYFPHGKAATQYPINYCKPQTVHGNTDLLLQWNRKVAQKVDACLSATTDSIKWSALWSNNGSSLQTTHHCSAEDITSNELLWCAERRERSMEVSTWELCPPPPPPPQEKWHNQAVLIWNANNMEGKNDWVWGVHRLWDSFGLEPSHLQLISTKFESAINTKCGCCSKSYPSLYYIATPLNCKLISSLDMPAY